jgi:hypothetical protein
MGAAYGHVAGHDRRAASTGSRPSVHGHAATTGTSSCAARSADPASTIALTLESLLSGAHFSGSVVHDDPVFIALGDHHRLDL